MAHRRHPEGTGPSRWPDRVWARILGSRWYARLRPVALRVWTAPLWLLSVSMALVLVAVIAYGASRPSNGSPAAPAITTSPSPTPSPTPTPRASPTSTAVPGPEFLQTQVSRIESRYGVQIGVAVTSVSPVGTLARTWTAGSVTTAPAWGTIDLPIAVAVDGLASAPPNLSYMLTKSISETSLSSDEALFSFLGDAQTAAGKTTSVLRGFGDPSTTVATSTSRQDAPAFTQTDWSVAAQAQFAGQLWCSSDAAFIVSRMGHVDSEHSYGFGRIIAGYIKTSEGTDDQGRPVLRQVAIAPTSTAGRIGAGLVVIGQKNQVETARQAADAVAAQVYFGASQIGGGQC